MATELEYENRMVASDLQIINLIANLCCRLCPMNSLHPLSTPHCGSNYPAKVLSVIKTASCMIIYQRLRRRAGELWHLLARSLARLLKLGRRKSNLKWAVKTGQRTRKSVAICPYLPAKKLCGKSFRNTISVLLADSKVKHLCGSKFGYAHAPISKDS